MDAHYMTSLKDQLLKRAECRSILELLEKDQNYQEYNSIQWKVLEAFRLIVRNQMNQISLVTLLDPQKHPDLLSIQNAPGLQDIVSLVQFLKSDEQFETLVNSVISKGDQWDEYPIKNTVKTGTRTALPDKGK